MQVKQLQQIEDRVQIASLKKHSRNIYLLTVRAIIRIGWKQKELTLQQERKSKRC